MQKLTKGALAKCSVLVANGSDKPLNLWIADEIERIAKTDKHAAALIGLLAVSDMGMGMGALGLYMALEQSELEEANATT